MMVNHNAYTSRRFKFVVLRVSTYLSIDISRFLSPRGRDDLSFNCKQRYVIGGKTFISKNLKKRELAPPSLNPQNSSLCSCECKSFNILPIEKNSKKMTEKLTYSLANSLAKIIRKIGFRRSCYLTCN